LEFEWLVLNFKRYFRWVMIFVVNLVAFACISFSNVSGVGDDVLLRAVLFLTGVAGEEELGSEAEEEMERLEALMRNPVAINSAPRSRLLASGLFSAYQVASLIDYRSRTGDVLSNYELSAVNGFSEEFVSVISPFISFSSSAAPGRSSVSSGASHSGETKSTVKFQEEGRATFGYGMKYAVAAGESFDAGASFKAPSSSPPAAPETWSLSAAYYGRRRLTKMIVGDFNARFGQGLCVWNGFSMSGFGSAAGLARRPTGLVRYGGFSPSYALRGLAAEFALGRVSLSAFGSLPVTGFEKYKGGGNSAVGINLSLPSLKGEAGLSAVVIGRSVFETDKSVRPLQSVRLSLDARYNIKGVDLFGEGAFDALTLKPALVLGTDFKAGECIRLGAIARYYSKDYGKLLQTNGMSSGTLLVAAARAGTYCSDERGLALAADISAGRWMSLSETSSVRRHIANISADLASLKNHHLQLKANAVYKFVPGGGWQLSSKLKLRLRNYELMQKYEFWENVSWTDGVWSASALAGLGHTVGLACAACLDGSVSLPYGEGRKIGLFLRVGAFHVDKWDDRLYIYERDIPGTFNVPALYGRGLWSSLLVNWKFARSFRLYLHCSIKTRVSKPSPSGDVSFSIVCTNLSKRSVGRQRLPPL